MMKNLATTFLLLVGIISVSFAQISDLEKNALIDLYNTTNGAEWNTTWDLNKDVSTWHGITIVNNAVSEICNLNLIPWIEVT